MSSWKSIDIEALISEIDARPTIWNVLSADYKDRLKKISSVICRVFFSARRQRSLL